MQRRIGAVFVVLALGAVLAGCGSSSGASPTASKTPVRSADAAGTPVASAGAAQDAQRFDKAVASYKTYLADQSSQLATAAQALSDAVASGDLARARSAYVAARPYFEHIASAAEYIDVAHKIDPQFLNAPADSTIGFHQVEQALWVQNSTAAAQAPAAKLAADCTALRDQLPSLKMDPLRMTEAYELLDKNPINSRFDIEPYSHTDLVDHQAHVDGSRVVFDALRPSIVARIPSLATAIEARFADVAAAMAPYRTGDGFVSYTALTPEQKQKLGQAFDALDEILSNVKTAISQPVS